MYLHLGQSTVIVHDEIIGIFDLDGTTVSKNTRNYLAEAEKNGRVQTVSNELPKSFIVCSDKHNDFKIYLSQISCATLLKRTQEMKY